MNRSNQIRFKSAERLTLFATLAIWSQIIFLAVAWLLPMVSPFSLLSDNISELALGRYGFMQTASFIISGLGTIGLAYTIQTLTVKSKKSTIGSVLVAVYGIGAILSALFPTDRIDSPADLETLTAIGSIHILIAMVSFLCIIIALVLLTWVFRKETDWKPMARLPIILLPCGAVTLMLTQSQGPLGGLMQRLLVTVICIWLIVAPIQVYRITTVRKA